jgi:cobalt-zinc-cadmium efflux system outer membrane protein
MKRHIIILAALFPLPALAEEASYPDLPQLSQVEAALKSNVNVMTAETGIKVEQANQRRWEAGNHEFSLRMGAAHRHVVSAERQVPEWDVALERPIRLPGKSGIDSSIGAEGVTHAEFVLGDSRHEASRQLLHMWFNWQRARAQAGQWQRQVEILAQQAEITEKRLTAGDAPRMELNQARAAQAQASVALQQARVRTDAAASELARQFPDLVLPLQVRPAEPQPVAHDLAYWRARILDHNHELGMAQSEARIQQLKAERSRADRTADPTIGVRYSNEMGGNERVTGVYVVVPFSFGMREAVAEGATYRAEIGAERESAVRRRLEQDALTAYNQGLGNFETWKQAHEAAAGVRQNADLIARAYALGESSLSRVLTAQRLALEAALTETMAQMDANEARYRLLLDAHMLWPLDENAAEASR